MFGGLFVFLPMDEARFYLISIVSGPKSRDRQWVQAVSLQEEREVVERQKT